MPEIIVTLRTPHPRQVDFIYSEAKRKVIRAGRRGGKAQPLDAKVYTSNGFTLMGDIQIGDDVVTPFGTLAVVEDIFPQGEVDIYKVYFTDGSFAECTGDHLWEINERRKDSKWKVRTRVITTSEIEKMSSLYGTNRRPSIPVTSVVPFVSRVTTLDPYLLGVLIGDGTMRHESITFSSADQFIIDQVANCIPDGVEVKRDRDSCDYRLSVGVGVQVNPIIRGLKELGLWGKYSYEKFIPDCYKYNTEEVRVAVIQGLLDTDGTVDHNGQPRFEQTSERLANDFAEVIQSLGGLCTIRSKMGGYKVDGVKKETRLVYRQVVRFKDAKQLFRLPRKKEKARKRVWKVKRYIDRIELKERDFAQCIKISDPRGLYLTNNFIVTHNTVGVATLAVEEFLKGKRVLYATPTEDQIGAFWYEVKQALFNPIEAGVYKKNEMMHTVELERTKQRIRAKTAFNADTLRGDYADVLILDEFQLMNEDAWNLVGAPMMLDTNGDAVFVYTPPTLQSRMKSSAKDSQHAAKLFKKAQLLEKEDPSMWRTFHFTSMENPHLNKKALEDIAMDMTSIAYRMEILAEDIDEAPNALWTRKVIEDNRILEMPKSFDKIVVAIDPSASSGGDEAGVVTVGKIKDHGYVLSDDSVQGTPSEWAIKAIDAYHRHKANHIVAEKNNGGEMIYNVLEQVDKSIKVVLVHASRGKATRAEPVSAVYEKGRGHHVGYFPKLEDEMATWMVGSKSPNRMDALVWAFTDLNLVGGTNWEAFVS